MEKLKAKHDHKLTDILKVFIFGLFLIMPGIFMLPSIMYYGVNKYATAPTKTTEVYEERQVNFNQNILNGNFENNQNYSAYGGTFSTNNEIGTYTITDILNNVYANNLVNTAGGYAVVGHKYYIRCYVTSPITYSNRFNLYIGGSYNYFNLAANEEKLCEAITTTATNQQRAQLHFGLYSNDGWQLNDIIQFRLFNCFDLTQMFGEGNEPTSINEFKTYYPNSYYPYSESKLETITMDTGETETYTDITTQIQYNWTSLWEQPLFSWTNYTILKQGIDNFTNVFGVTNTSNITNLIVYELIIVAIYIVIDIVIQIFKWLTHLIGAK